jgi:hypothetical protein
VEKTVEKQDGREGQRNSGIGMAMCSSLRLDSADSRVSIYCANFGYQITYDVPPLLLAI